MPYAYGGMGYITEIMDSSGGLISTAKALVQFANNILYRALAKDVHSIKERMGRCQEQKVSLFPVAMELIMHTYLTQVTKFRDRGELELVSSKKSTSFCIIR